MCDGSKLYLLLLTWCNPLGLMPDKRIIIIIRRMWRMWLRIIHSQTGIACFLQLLDIELRDPTDFRYRENTSMYFTGIKDPNYVTGGSHYCSRNGDTTYLIISHVMPLNELLWRVKPHPRTGHQDIDGEYRYRYTLSLTSALDGGGCSTPRLGRFTPPPRKKTR
jgi:hypothetical protein